MLPAARDAEKSQGDEVTPLDCALALTDGQCLADSGEGRWVSNGLRKLKHAEVLISFFFF